MLCFLQIVSVSTGVALAAQQTVPEERSSVSRFVRINFFEIDLSISKAGLSNSFACVSLKHSADTVKLTLELQRQNGTTWNQVKSWSTTGSGIVYIESDWYVSSGYTYRVQATANVYNSSGTLLETVNITSGTVKY